MKNLIRGKSAEVNVKSGEFIGSSRRREGHRADIYHGEVALPHGVATTIAKWARPLQGVATALTAVQGDVLLAPRHPASAQRTR